MGFQLEDTIMINLTNYGQAVAGIVIRENKVLLARHTYGAGKGKLIIPGGYVNKGETPQQAVIRELFEETGITVKPTCIVGIRFNTHDWYVVFSADYISGIAQSEGNENNEVLWIDINEIESRDDVPELTKKLVCSVCKHNNNLTYTSYEGNAKHAPYSLYC